MSTREFLEHTDIIIFIQGVDEKGTEAYAYLAVKSSNMLEFMRRSQIFPLALEQCGTVLAAGEGLPSAQVQLRMKTQFGFNQEDIIAIPPHTSS